MPDVFLQDPDEALDYIRDWSTDLVGDTIATSTWTAPVGITIDDDSNTTTTATVWISGGTLGNDYDVTNRIVTAGGRTLEHTIQFRIRAK
jgi:hypothetical protein